MNESRAAGSSAVIVGSPGVHPRQRGWLMLFGPLLAGAFVAGWCLRAALPVPEIPPQWAGFLLTFLVCAMAAFILHMRRRQLDFARGARGEEETARILARLPADVRVFHGLTGGDDLFEDIDHAVVSSRGVFIVDTLNWSGRTSIADGRILYNGHPPDRDPIERIQRMAGALRAALQKVGVEAPVQPVLCLPHAALTRDVEGLSGVIVCRQTALTAVLRESVGTKIADDAIARIAALLAPMTEVRP